MSEIRPMLEEMVNKVLKDNCTKELINAAEKGTFPADLWDTLSELGVTAVGIDEDKGGSGGDLGDLMALLKIAGYFAAPIPLAEHTLANWMRSKAGLTAKSELSTFAPVSREDQIIFDPTDEGWSVSGKASFVPWGKDVQFITVLGKTNEGQYITASIPSDQCIINSNQNLAGEPRDEVVINQVAVSKQEAGLVDDQSADNLFSYAMMSRVMQMAGSLERALELSVTYTKERTQFGRPISKFQAIQQQLAIMAGETTASLAVADFIISNIDRNISFEETAMAKIQLGDAAGIATRIAHQVHAAIGFTDEHVLHHSTRRLWSWRDEFGTESVLAEAVGQRILSDAENLWDFITKPPAKVTVE